MVAFHFGNAKYRPKYGIVSIIVYLHDINTKGKVCYTNSEENARGKCRLVSVGGNASDNRVAVGGGNISIDRN